MVGRRITCFRRLNRMHMSRDDPGGLPFAGWLSSRGFLPCRFTNRSMIMDRTIWFSWVYVWPFSTISFDRSVCSQHTQLMRDHLLPRSLMFCFFNGMHLLRFHFTSYQHVFWHSPLLSIWHSNVGILSESWQGRPRGHMSLWTLAWDRLISSTCSLHYFKHPVW